MGSPRRPGRDRPAARPARPAARRAPNAAAQAALEERRRRERVQEAADFCAGVVQSGWQATVTGRAAAYITEATWKQLFRGRHRKRCQALARSASQLLAGKQQIHKAMGPLASSLLGGMGSGDFARAMAAELVSSLPLPIDAKIHCRRPLYVTIAYASARALTRARSRDRSQLAGALLLDLALNAAWTRLFLRADGTP